MSSLGVAAPAAEAPADLPPEPPKPPIVSTTVDPPDNRAYGVRFRPWARPSVPQVHRMIAVEAARWGAPKWRLSCRVRGESTYRWWKRNGQYAGLGQFALSTFNRGVRTMPRGVRFEERSTALRRELVTRRYSDGSVRRWRGRLHRVKVRRVYVGKIPKRPDRLHGWAHVRIMAQAMVGRSAVGDGEWEVRC